MAPCLGCLSHVDLLLKADSPPHKPSDSIPPSAQSDRSACRSPQTCIRRKRARFPEANQQLERLRRRRHLWTLEIFAWRAILPHARAGAALPGPLRASAGITDIHCIFDSCQRFLGKRWSHFYLDFCAHDAQAQPVHMALPRQRPQPLFHHG